MYQHPSWAKPFDHQALSFTNLIQRQQNYFFSQQFAQKQQVLSHLREPQLFYQSPDLRFQCVPQLYYPLQFERPVCIQTQFHSHYENSFPITHNEDQPAKVEDISLKFEDYSSISSTLPKNEEKGLPSTSTQVAQIVCFFLEEFGKLTQEDVAQERLKFSFDKTSLNLFDNLVQKYSSALKSKEDMSRFVLRKAIAYLRDRLRKKRKLSVKQSSVALCKKYFKEKVQEITKVGRKRADLDNNQEILNFLLPYKKNSRNKTPNSAFVREIFSSRDFCCDFSQFLVKFDEIMEKDNEKKIKKFTDFLVRCVEENTIHLLNGYKRLPWLKYWLGKAKVIAQKLLDENKKVDAFMPKKSKLNKKRHSIDTKMEE